LHTGIAVRGVARGDGCTIPGSTVGAAIAFVTGSRIMRFIRAFLLWVLIFVIAGGIFIWSGAYDIGADSPHWPVTRHLIGVLSDRSIHLRSSDISAPPLNDPALVKVGARHYAEMCAGCHLSPGMADTDLRRGLYPTPPNLTRFAPEPSEAFWIIKHGIKMTAMPAWGKTHDDQEIWAIVAFLQKQPKMGAAEYRELSGAGSTQGAMGAAPAATRPAPAASASSPASASTSSD
jgi:mono/diheme cytochrome c family protein